MNRVALAAILLVPLALGACQVPGRVAAVGQAPALEPIENPVERPGYKPVSLPMPDPEPMVSAGANSLWRSGARGFFRDQRARRVGDVLTVNVTIEDRAELSNRTSRGRTSEDTQDVTGFYGLQNKLKEWLPEPIDPSELVALESTMDNAGRGAINREETIEINVAAIITQLLPNGNMVIEGHQEVAVNFEKREIVVAGIVRPEDITPQNTIPHEKIAELRVAYGGEGQITDVQQPRYGAQVLDILLPY